MKSIFLVLLSLSLFCINNKAIVSKESPVLAIGIPKCGTNLLGKLIKKLTGKKLVNELGIFIHNGSYLNTINLETFDFSSKFLNTHTMPFDETVAYLKKRNFKIIFIYRDPRDQIISWMNYITKQPKWKDFYKTKDANTFITKWITDTSTIFYSDLSYPLLKQTLKGIDSLYYHFLSWIDHNFVYATSFEKLVGSQGGGSDILQMQEIKNIATHLNIRLTDQELQDLCKSLFGGTGTFRSGHIGAWKNFFTADHKKLFKQIAGDLLIKLGYESNNDW